MADIAKDTPPLGDEPLQTISIEPEDHRRNKIAAKKKTLKNLQWMRSKDFQENKLHQCEHRPICSSPEASPTCIRLLKKSGGCLFVGV